MPRSKSDTSAAIKKRRSPFSISVYDKEGASTATIELPSDIFGVEINRKLMAQAVRVYLANQRSGTASTKTRGEVRGSTRKIYRQKGTGRARHGAITAPIFMGGGIVFGPKPRDYRLLLPKKMKRKSLFSALTLRFKENKIVVVDGIETIPPKTKEMVSVLQALNLLKKDKRADNVLFLLPRKIEEVERAARNIKGLALEKVQNIHTYEILVHKHILMTKDSIPALSSTFVKDVSFEPKTTPYEKN